MRTRMVTGAILLLLLGGILGYAAATLWYSPAPVISNSDSDAGGGNDTAGNSGGGNATDGNSGGGKATDGNSGGGNATDGNSGSGNATDGNSGSGNATDGNSGGGNATDGNSGGGSPDNGDSHNGSSGGTSQNGSGDTQPGSGPPSCQPGQAADYFPYHLGAQASYAGSGNEFASFGIEVIYETGGKVEWRKNDGGTTLAEVYQVTPQQVTLIYREGEAYDNAPRHNQPPNQSEPILKGPIQVGNQWTSGSNTYKIVSTNASVQALGSQTLTCVVVVEVQSGPSLIRNYYHKQYGLVLTVFDPNGSPIESRLATFTP